MFDSKDELKCPECGESLSAIMKGKKFILFCRMCNWKDTKSWKIQDLF